jgi:hypothetical protein
MESDCVYFFDCQRESDYCFSFVKNYLHGPAVSEWLGAVQYIFSMMIIFDKSKTIIQFSLAIRKKKSDFLSNYHELRLCPD